MKELLIQTLQTFGITAIRYFVIAGIPFLIFYKFFSSRFSKQKIQKRLAGKTDFIREILYSMLSSLVFAFIGAVVLFTPLVNYTQIYQDINAYSWWWLPLSVGLSLVIHDTYFYWMHRILHHKVLFRHAHLVHHKSTNPSPWSSYSFHLLEAIVEGGILVVVTFALPMHPLAVILFIVSGFIINVYGHLGYELMPRNFRHSIWFEVLNTSVHHNLHHSKFKGNYGLYFRVWDRLMGTEHPDYVKEYDKVQTARFWPDSKEEKAVQLEQPPYRSSVLHTDAAK